MSESAKPTPPPEESVRDHVFDGIQEYNNRMPNWWLITLYASIAFSIGYWFYYAQSGVPLADGDRVTQEMARIEAAKMASNLVLDDENLWLMSRNAVLASAGKQTFESTCASCHGANLAGGIGPSLVDGNWLHGGTPTDVYKVVNEGVLVKGMPAWGPVLGARKVSEVVAYIMSLHQPPG
jgi:cytochrome c oxidase cbb3-type subunit III